MLHEDLPHELNKITGAILDSAIEVHRELGPGLLEKVYKAAMTYELGQRGHQVDITAHAPIFYKGIPLGGNLCPDLLVDNSVVVELKCAAAHHPVFIAQMRGYTRNFAKPVGLLINFGFPRLIDGYERFVNLRDSVSP